MHFYDALFYFIPLLNEAWIIGVKNRLGYHYFLEDNIAVYFAISPFFKFLCLLKTGFCRYQRKPRR